MIAAARKTVIFDLGGVLIDWDPRHLYRKLFPGDEAAMERFLAEVCTGAWNLQQDAGRSWAEATAELRAKFPEQAPMIDAYHHRWPEMIAGSIEGTVRILRELHVAGTPLFALTNWSAETFPVALERFDFMALFRGTLVSGAEKLIKPDPAIFRLILSRFEINPAEAVFIDDVPRNAEAATALGIHGIRFTSPEALRAELRRLGFPLAEA
ncbi:HAD family hydrolase [Roseomonas elaeocarpi]|uniref:HAD family hydrolase n=1 Tax=Roseomonas elaeocarpi TaxID=907779 RepID=A0ABV6JVR2_9PROT